ncbi:hypothetical protein T439DRAFT_328960 [Meredithblackwellia eburnea MCA 4105]
MMRLSFVLFALAVCSSSHAAPTTSGLSDSALSQIKSNLAGAATDTWVSGTQTIALLELDYPSYSVFTPSSLTSLANSSDPVPTEVNSIITSWYTKRSSSSVQFADVSGGAAGDPASLGTAWIIAALTDGGMKLKMTYATIIQKEVNYLLNTVPKTSDGAISMRPAGEAVQIWSDFIFMVPPFLAFYGVVMNQPSVVTQSYNQIKLYRNYLRDSSTGLWKHVELGSYQDNGLWGTGNAWAAAGMTRVLATMMHCSDSEDYSSQISDLSSWINEILSATFSQISSSSNLLPNYYHSSSTFSDAASSALLASVVYRMASLGELSNTSLINTAEKVRQAVNSAATSNSGWLNPVVDPLVWNQQSTKSPEAEAFVIMLQAAWRDYWANQ